MKKLFEFTLNKEIEKDIEENSINEKGETVKTIKKVKESAAQKYFVRRPNRALRDEAELFYGSCLSEGIKAGLLTNAQLARRYNNDGGVFSEDEKTKYQQLALKLFEKTEVLQRLDLIKEKNETEQKQKDDALKEIVDIRSQLQNYELTKQTLLDCTAESRARNKTIIWWLLNLSYFINEKDEEQSFFSGATYQEKLKSYDIFDDLDDVFTNDLINKKFLYYVTIWALNGPSNQKDFEILIKALGEQTPT